MAAVAAICPSPIPAAIHGGRAATATRRRIPCRASGGGGKQASNQSGKKAGEEEESREILNAFFLGKAFADAVAERVTSAVGEIVSELGRKQAQQQKDIRQFQEEVERRAKDSMARSNDKLIP